MTSPDLTAAEQDAIRHFWEIYDRDYDAIRAELMEVLRERHPREAAIVDASEAERERQAAVDRRLSRAAAVDGEWGPFVAHLREQGHRYAEAGMDFASWFQITRAYRPLVLPRLIEAYGDDTDGLLTALRGMDAFIEIALSTIGQSYVDAVQDVVHRQHEAIRELSTPVLVLRRGLLLMPIVGVVDSTRSRHITDALLQAIRAHRGKVAVIDITGVPEVDTEVANRLLQTTEAARLMGATAIVTGLSASVAQALVTLGVDLGSLRTLADLQTGIEEADELLGNRWVADGVPQ